MVDFASLRKKSKAGGSFQDLQKALETADRKGFKDDERYWTLSVDKTGKGSATIRFLPGSAKDEFPFVQIWTHGFKGPTGKWYIENSLTTLGQDDPVSAANSLLWDTGLKENQDIARSRKRRHQYISNILVVDDPANPANNGGVFLFKHGPKIFEKLKSAACPEFDDVTPLNPYCMWTGANFVLRAVNVNKQRTYEQSSFEAPSAIGDDAKCEEIFNQLHHLGAEIAPDKFKSYEVLEKHLRKVLGLDGVAARAFATAEDRPTGEEDVSEPDEVVDAPEAKATTPKAGRTTKFTKKPEAKASSKVEVETTDDGDDFDDSFFANLANELQ